MYEDQPNGVRPQSLGEEIANSISHGLGFVAALVLGPFLLLEATPHGTPAVVGAAVFAGSMALLYLISALYHSLARTRAARLLQVLDHCAIYLLIAGTYTPFTLGVLSGPLGWTLCALVWLLAIGGIVAKSVGGARRWPRLSTTLYLAMGWLVLIAARPVWLEVPIWGVVWLAAGGVTYTAGVAFYAIPNVPYSHFVWHLFVLAGTACHVVAVRWYAS
jgi:hemolysin III